MDENFRAAWSQSAAVTKSIARYAYVCIPGPGIACVGGDISGKTSGSSLLLPLFSPNMDLAQFFNTAFKTAIVIGAMLAVLRLGYAGQMYMTSDIWSSKEKAKTIIQEALLGLLLLLSVWLILNQINPNLLNLDILQNVKPAPKLETQTTSSGASEGFCPQGQRWNDSNGTCTAIPYSNAPSAETPWCFYSGAFGFWGNRTCAATSDACVAARPAGLAGTCSNQLR